MQVELFQLFKPQFKITNRIRLIELFGGIGAQAKALENIGADFEHYRYIEIDKYACDSYNAVHGTNFTPTDIQTVHGADLGIVDTDSFTYLLTYSFPCTDLSVAGLQMGMSKGSGTRSGLLWEVERLLCECETLPQVLVMENVPMVRGEKNIDDFKAWTNFLESKGYTNYAEDLNAKDFGIPQSRDRCFMVSILGDYYFRFPETKELKFQFKDFLEEKVDDKYYITSEKAQILIDTLISEGKIPTNERTNERTNGMELTSVQNTQNLSTTQTQSKLGMMQESEITNSTIPECVNALGFLDKGSGLHQSNVVYDTNGLMPTQCANQYKEPYKVAECQRLKF